MKKIYFRSFAKFFLIATCPFILSNCKKDNLDDTLLQNAGLATTGNLKSQLMASTGLITENSFYIESALPDDHVTDGSRDYTTIIQSALLKYPNIVFPDFPILINDKGLNVPSNRIITFLEGSELRMKATSAPGYGILKMRNASNVTLVNPVLKGDRYKHTGTTGEWGMGISIYGGSNITVLSPKAREMWGDGIYIGSENGVIPRNITIKDAVLEYNRRDGITIVAVDGLKLENIYAAFSNGTLPMSGIAFEPNDSDEEIKNVVISNPRTQENLGAGIFVDFGNLMGGGQKSVGVTITNHTDIKSNIGVRAISRISDGSSSIQGNLKLVNPKWSRNPLKGIATTLFGENDVHLYIENPIIIDLAGHQLTKDETIEYLNNKRQINPSAWSSISFSSSWPNIVVESPIELDSDPISVAKPEVVYALNTGGSAFTASNGVTYQSDKGFSGGQTYTTSNSISNTTDDILYRTERYGNFGYAIPLADGTYEVTLRFAEIYHSLAAQRQFDVIIEGNEVISNLDIFKVVGSFNAYDVVRSVQVTDGVLNLNFKSDIDNAKVGAFHIVKK